MTNKFLRLLDKKAIEDLKSNKTIAEKEANYFLLSYGFGEQLHTTETGVGILKQLDNIKGWFKARATLCTLMLKSMYQAFNNSDEVKEFFKNEIHEILQVSEDQTYNEVHEIKYLWEYEIVVYYLYLYGYDAGKISTLEKRDRKKIYDEKRKFEKEKKKTISFLKAQDISIDEVMKLIYRNKEDHYLFVNYESTLNHAKDMLYAELTQRYNTGKERAKKIIRILDHI